MTPDGLRGARQPSDDGPAGGLALDPIERPGDDSELGPAALRALDETPLLLLTCAGLPPSSTDRTPALFNKLDLFRDTVARMVRALR